MHVSQTRPGTDRVIGRAGLRWIPLALLLALISAVVGMDARGADRTYRVRFVYFDLTAEELDIAQMALRSHLSEYPVLLETIPAAHEDLPGSSRRKSAISQAPGASTIVWLSKGRSSFHIYSPEISNREKTITFSPDQESWVLKCEVIGATVGFELKLMMGDVREPVPEASPPTDSLAPPESVPPMCAQRRVRTVFALGYAPILMSANGPFVNGASIGFGLTFGKYLGIELNGGVVQNVTIRTENDTGRFTQGNFRVRLMGCLPLGSMELGLRLGPVFEAWRILGLDTPRAPSVGRVQMKYGLSSTAVFSYWPVGWLGLFVEAGLDTYFEDSRYVEENETLLHQQPLQLRTVIGISFSIL